MRKIEYNSNVASDIYDIKNQDKKSDIIVNTIIKTLLFNAPIGLITMALSAVDITFPKYAAILAPSVVAIINSYIAVFSPIRKIRLRKQRGIDADKKIDELSVLVGDDPELDTNFITNTIEKEAIIDSIQVHESNKETVSSYFYFLDNQDQLIVLKQIKENITNNNVKEELYLLDESELPNPLPVVRRLERK